MSRKEKLGPEIKLELVGRYLKGEISQSQASNKTEVDSHSFRQWIMR